ncbi:MAG: Hpt domain-containing protein [Acidobacteriaceae bacterium]|nr:Hpt domain-containing protein [Acidobacteriaceae bacterium]
MKTLSQIVQELTPGYVAARKQEITQMRALLAASDFDRLAVLSHSMKGSGSSFGFPELTRFGATLEHHARASDSAAFGEELSRLKDYLEQVKAPGEPARTSS